MPPLAAPRCGGGRLFRLTTPAPLQNLLLLYQIHALTGKLPLLYSRYMELLLSSPVVIVGALLAIIIVAVFLYELKVKSKAHNAQIAPAPLPMQPKKNSAVLLFGGIILFLILISLPILLIFVRNRQEVQKRASEPVPPASTTREESTPPSAFSLSPTSPPTAAFSNLANQIPTCLTLTADPTSGRPPLSTTLQARGNDTDDGIAAFVFSFGDGTSKRIEKPFAAGTQATQTIDHVYTELGTYEATVRLEDTKGGLSIVETSCTKTIAVTNTPGSSSAAIGGTSQATSSATPTVTKKPLPTNKPLSATSSASTATKSAVPKLPESGHDDLTALLGIGGIIAVFTALAFVL